MSTRRERAKEPIRQMNKQLAIAEESRRRETYEKNLHLWKSEYLTDLSKLVLAGVLIGGIFQPVKHPKLLYAIGFVIFLSSIYFAYRYYKRGIK